MVKSILARILGNIVEGGMLAYRVYGSRREIYDNWQELDAQMPRVNRAFNHVRGELYDVGLLSENKYLDEIDLNISILPSYDEAGYMYEESTLARRIAGYKAGVIYLPSDLPSEAYIPGGTLTDTIRHEYAHAWHWLDPKHIDRRWFVDAFETHYNDLEPYPALQLEERLLSDHKFVREVNRKSTEEEKWEYFWKHAKKEFVSEYALTCAREDFAETFMYFLRYRNSLHRFTSREGVYKKLLAVKDAVERKRQRLKL